MSALVNTQRTELIRERSLFVSAFVYTQEVIRERIGVHTSKGAHLFFCHDAFICVPCQMARDVLEFVDTHLGVREISVIGHSMGGKVCACVCVCVSMCVCVYVCDDMYFIFH